MTETILVTGATGTVGSEVVKQLVSSLSSSSLDKTMKKMKMSLKGMNSVIIVNQMINK
jgi:FlaA1/EpsC-like NDP-sugar epimerase